MTQNNSGAHPPYPSRASAYYVASIVLFASLFAFLDRQILALLVAPIRKDLVISDTQISLLYGFAFVILYSTLGVAMGRLIDRRQRRLILAAGIAVWSVMTILCGLATGFWDLFAARIGVGVGEACLTPAACSLLADCFRPQQRGRAMNFYFFGVYAGLGLSMAASGLLYDWLLHHPGLPLLGQLAPWRGVFILVGAPGLLMALLVLTMREPARQGYRLPATNTSMASAEADSLLAYLRQNRRTILAVFFAHGLVGFVNYGLIGWAPTHLIRHFGLSTSLVGPTLGLFATIGGMIGAAAGTFLCDRWTNAGMPAAKFRVLAIGVAIAVPPLLLLPFAPTATVAIACVGLCMIAMPFAGSAGQPQVQELFPNHFRGQGSALVVLLLGLFGAGCGPLAVGLASDLLFAGGDGLAFAIATVALPAMAVTVGLYFFGRHRYEATRARATAMGEFVPPAEPASMPKLASVSAA
ncbi:MAG: hypothetical protein JWM77_822 [Rhodospirillales bacterium]|nr:hypothetical protein [Rhodospirillales bacterium]